MKNARNQSNFISNSICDIPGFGLWGDMGDYGIAVLSFFSSGIGNFDFDVQYCPII